MRRTFHFPISSVFRLLVLAIAVAAVAKPPSGGMYLTISAGGVSTSDTRYGDRTIIAGTMAGLSIGVLEPDNCPVVTRKTDSIADWPQGLTIYVGTTWGEEKPEWFKEMRLRPTDISDQSKNEQYNFTFTVPKSAAGDTLALSASFDHPLYGHLETTRTEKLRVITVQYNEALETFRDSRIKNLYQAQEYSQVLSTVDSLAELGYTSFIGLDYATSASLKLNNFTAAIHYLDLNMSANGAIVPDFGYDDLQPTAQGKVIDHQRRAVRNQEKYQALRNQLLRKIEEQRHQQK